MKGSNCVQHWCFQQPIAAGRTCHLEVEPLEMSPVVLGCVGVRPDAQLDVAWIAGIHHLYVSSIESRTDVHFIEISAPQLPVIGHSYGSR
jgi:hypothetical protein